MAAPLRPKLQMLAGRVPRLPPQYGQAPIDRIRGGRLQAMRRRVLLRDHGLCQLCKAAGNVVPAAEVDHIIPLWAGGQDAEANMQAICQQCHQTKTAAEAAARATAGR